MLSGNPGPGAAKTTLRRLWKDGGGSLSIVHDPGMTPKQLASFTLAHARERYAGALFQILANHPKASGKLFRLLLGLTGNAPDIASAIIHTGKAPRSLLRLLKKSSSRSVQEHADLAFIEATMDFGDLEKSSRLLQRHWGKDDGISLGVRHLMAEHPNTPRRILKRLTEDDADFISVAAAKRLADSSRRPERKNG
jgi:hypothetical protein